MRLSVTCPHWRVHLCQLSFVQVEDILEALSSAMSGYCLNKGLVPKCLLIPEMAFAPFAGALVWGVILVISALLLLQGAISGERQAPN